MSVRGDIFLMKGSSNGFDERRGKMEMTMRKEIFEKPEPRLLIIIVGVQTQNNLSPLFNFFDFPLFQIIINDPFNYRFQ